MLRARARGGGGGERRGRPRTRFGRRAPLRSDVGTDDAARAEGAAGPGLGAPVCQACRRRLRGRRDGEPARSPPLQNGPRAPARRAGGGRPTAAATGAAAPAPAPALPPPPPAPWPPRPPPPPPPPGASGRLRVGPPRLRLHRPPKTAVGSSPPRSITDFPESFARVEIGPTRPRKEASAAGGGAPRDASRPRAAASSRGPQGRAVPPRAAGGGCPWRQDARHAPVPAGANAGRQDIVAACLAGRSGARVARGRRSAGRAAGRAGRSRATPDAGCALQHSHCVRVERASLAAVAVRCWRMMRPGARRGAARRGVASADPPGGWIETPGRWASCMGAGVPPGSGSPRPRARCPRHHRAANRRARYTWRLASHRLLPQPGRPQQAAGVACLCHVRNVRQPPRFTGARPSLLPALSGATGTRARGQGRDQGLGPRCARRRAALDRRGAARAAQAGHDRTHRPVPHISRLSIRTVVGYCILLAGAPMPHSVARWVQSLPQARAKRRGNTPSRRLRVGEWAGGGPGE